MNIICLKPYPVLSYANNSELVLKPNIVHEQKISILTKIPLNSQQHPTHSYPLKLHIPKKITLKNAKNISIPTLYISYRNEINVKIKRKMIEVNGLEAEKKSISVVIKIPKQARLKC